MKQIVWLGLGFATGCLGPWPGPEGSGTGTFEPNVGFVYVGPVGDHGWTKSHDDGRLALEADLDVPTTYVPSVLPADGLAVMDELVAGGTNVVFTTSFDFVSSTQQAAANHPEASFLNCSGNVYAPNLSSYMGRMYQPIYLAGLVAGSTTQTDHVAVLASVPIPEVVRHVNAFALGVREANPQAVVEVVWIMNFFDVTLEPLYTQALIDHGADVILTQTDTTIPIEAADGKKVHLGEDAFPVYTIAYDNVDGCAHAPDTCLTSAYWNWGPMYTALVSQIADGTWNPEDIRWDQMESTPETSTVALADFNPIVKGEVRLMVDGHLPTLVDPDNVAVPFVGPIRDAVGDLRVSAGDALDDTALNRMCWHVEGVMNWDEQFGALVPATVPNGCGGDI
ncbi:MAG: BMP family ABC transporter substrate-binding protein [Myxococcota bacterium]